MNKYLKRLSDFIDVLYRSLNPEHEFAYVTSGNTGNTNLNNVKLNGIGGLTDIYKGLIFFGRGGSKKGIESRDNEVTLPTKKKPKYVNRKIPPKIKKRK
jgi:hypothetical protein